MTGFLGRTKVGDVVQMYVLHERRRLLATDPATVPSGQGFSVVLTDWLPREPVEIEIRMPWDTGSARASGKVAVGRDAKGRRRVAATGLLAGLLARRPAGTPEPGRRAGRHRQRRRRPPHDRAHSRCRPADDRRRRRPSCRPTATTQLTVSGAEPSGRYELDAEWTCPARRRPAAARASSRTRSRRRWAGRSPRAVDASTVNFGLFDEACAGATPPDSLPATLVLYRVGEGRGSASSSRERVATVAGPGGPGLTSRRAPSRGARYARRP